jgi:hypothetical protein
MGLRGSGGAAYIQVNIYKSDIEYHIPAHAHCHVVLLGLARTEQVLSTIHQPMARAMAFLSMAVLRRSSGRAMPYIYAP